MRDRRQKTEVRGQKTEDRSQDFFYHQFSVIGFLFFLVSFLSSVISFPSSGICQSQDTGGYVKKGWNELGRRNFDEVYKITDACILNFKDEADKIALTLHSLPPKGKETSYKVLNDVATCYFIKGEALMREKKISEAEKIFDTIVKKYPYAQAWDPRGWFWSLKEKAEITLKKLKTGRIEEKEKGEGRVSKIVLSNTGTEFPVDYEKYGEFKGVGTSSYKYVVNDQAGLARACGEGVYPDTTSLRYDPKFIEVKKKLYKINQWNALNSRDLSLAFYKWNVAGEPQGIKQFYIASLLERSGLIKQAVKAYYAVIAHFPQTYGWTYWHTPWYVGPAALSRLNYLLTEHPELGFSLKGAYIKVKGGFDHNIANDVFIVNPGRFVKRNVLDFFNRNKRINFGKVIKESGNRVKLVQYESGDWQLFVGGRPFVVKGITYAPTRVGESPDEGTLSDWMKQDVNNNGIIDGPYEAWVDKNGNNKQDDDEKTAGDFYLMKEMGVNCIRIYHQPHEPDKELLRKLYDKYGIMVIMGDFLGKYAIGSGAEWSKGTDYSNSEQQAKMLGSVKKMVNDFKNEPYVLMWLLGNENVYGVACNADKDPDSFFKFVNKTAKFVKSLDPSRPVAIASGDNLFLDIFGKDCPDVDIFGTNAYRGKYGFGNLFANVKEYAGKPIMITEYGAPAYGEGYSKDEAESFQAEYHKNCWQNMADNFAGYGTGNVLGGIVFEWLDEWWKAYEPGYHDRKGLFSGPFLDGFMHEEWLGLSSQGDGKDSPFLRQLRKSYFTYKALWHKN